ncbi:MAG: hypothetical protein OXT65_04235 [Alphaproteobacteria bacterium]|nr:hypothetical protein [Alphaproteobacteria bacterium]
MTYRIVKATQDRMPDVAKAFKKSFLATYPNFPELHTLEEDKAFLTDTIFPKNAVFLAETEDKSI